MCPRSTLRGTVATPRAPRAPRLVRRVCLRECRCRSCRSPPPRAARKRCVPCAAQTSRGHAPFPTSRPAVSKRPTTAAAAIKSYAPSARPLATRSLAASLENLPRYRTGACHFLRVASSSPCASATLALIVPTSSDSYQQQRSNTVTENDTPMISSIVCLIVCAASNSVCRSSRQPNGRASDRLCMCRLDSFNRQEFILHSRKLRIQDNVKRARWHGHALTALYALLCLWLRAALCEALRQRPRSTARTALKFLPSNARLKEKLTIILYLFRGYQSRVSNLWRSMSTARSSAPPAQCRQSSDGCIGTCAWTFRHPEATCASGRRLYGEKRSSMCTPE